MSESKADEGSAKLEGAAGGETRDEDEEEREESISELKEALEEKLKEISEAEEEEDEEAEIEADEKIKKELTEEEMKLVEEYSLYDLVYKDKELYKKLVENSVEVFSITFPDLSPRANLNYITLSINYILDHYFITWYESNPWCDYDDFYTDVGDDFELAKEEMREIVKENYEEAIKDLEEDC